MSDTQSLIEELAAEKQELLAGKELTFGSLSRVKADLDQLNAVHRADMEAPGVTQHQRGELKRAHTVARREMSARQTGLEGTLREQQRSIETCNASLNEFQNHSWAPPLYAESGEGPFVQGVVNLLRDAGWTVEPPS
jgi:hypothetical protein